MSGQAIRTKYYPATNHKPSCIRAKCEAGSIRVPYNHSLNLADNHLAAFLEMRGRLDWIHLGGWEAGVFNGDFYWVRK
jgi:hypothetical protein